MAKKTQPKIGDIGEKIGGARKDVAKRGVAKTGAGKDATPSWEKNFVVRQDTYRGGWGLYSKTGKSVLNQRFASEAEAIAAKPLAAVAQHHRPYEHYNSESKTSTFQIVREIAGGKKRPI